MLGNGKHKPLGNTQVIESIPRLFIEFKEVLVPLVVQLDILRQLLVLGGEEREVLPNNHVPVLLVSEFPFGLNVIKLNGWLDLVTAT